MPNHINAEICAGAISSNQGILDYLTDTYLYRRLFANPTYYFVDDASDEEIIIFLNKIVKSCINELLESRCILVDEVNTSFLFLS